MDWYAQTVKTYDDSAKALAAYYKNIGSQVHDIERALELAATDGLAKVIEVGCGDGRDAVEIVKRTKSYQGIDPSRGLLKIARRKLPDESFTRADALSFNYPKNIDVIFAFASLLHVARDDMYKVFDKAAQSLRSGGIFYITLKQRDAYEAELQVDEHGQRMFHYYNPELIKEIAGDLFTTVHEASQKISGTNWFTIALKRS